MMTLQSIKVDRNALADLRRSEEVQAILEKKANEAQRALGAEHYDVKSYSFAGVGGRVVTKVYASDYKGKQENFDHNSIIKAVLATKEVDA